MPTPHIEATPSDFAEAVLLPGDPLRAEHIAEQFLDGARRVNAVRNMLGFTGSFRGMPVSVMGTGMGIPSASIYIHELINDYGAKRLIRVGSCGGLGPEIRLRDVVLAIGASTDSLTNRSRYGGMDFAATADFGLLQSAYRASEQRGVAVRVGNVHSADLFYRSDQNDFDTMVDMGVLAVEMEAAGLYGVAAEQGVRALAILTVSDLVGSDESTSAEERQKTLDEMVSIALEALIIDQTDQRTG